MRQVLLAVMVCLLPAVAHADRLVDPLVIPDGRSYSQRIKQGLSEMSLTLNQHFDKLSGSMLNLKFDLTQRTGNFHLGGGDSEFGLRIASDIKFERGYANFKTTLDLAVAGESYKLELPEVDMVPRSLDGERFVEVRMPLLKGRF